MLTLNTRAIQESLTIILADQGLGLVTERSWDSQGPQPNSKPKGKVKESQIAFR